MSSNQLPSPGGIPGTHVCVSVCIIQPSIDTKRDMRYESIKKFLQFFFGYSYRERFHDWLLVDEISYHFYFISTQDKLKWKRNSFKFSLCVCVCACCVIFFSKKIQAIKCSSTLAKLISIIVSNTHMERWMCCFCCCYLNYAVYFSWVCQHCAESTYTKSI